MSTVFRNGTAHARGACHSCNRREAYFGTCRQFLVSVETQVVPRRLLGAYDVTKTIGSV